MFPTSKTRLRLIAFGDNSGGGSVTDPNKILPAGFKFAESNGKLQLFKGTQLINEQDESGAWVKTSVRTGTGSIHIGDLHSNGSGGE